MVDEQATASWVAKVPEVTLIFCIIKILCTTEPLIKNPISITVDRM